ncbi:hypothetical protein ABES02_29345 [Neobacillus pocheonensis]|uniref:hypothetical protein n=1 Tax=Neobacillus pocheonensis TaxID=363869 RepID=UPI003D2E7C98
MFTRALAEMLTVYFLIIYLFQPPLHELFNIRSNAVEIVLNQGIAKASSLQNGRFTPEIIEEMKVTLNQKFFVPKSSIVFVGTTTITPRGDYIEGTLTVKATPLWIFQNMFGNADNSPKTITRYATMMSEYIDR